MSVFIAVRPLVVVMVVIVAVFIMSGGGEIKVITCFGMYFVVICPTS
jgi:hypothetical protein